MHEMPSPALGYLPIVVAFWICIVLAGIVALGTSMIGVSANGAFVVFFLVAGVLLQPFVPLFRRRGPNKHAETESRT